MKKPNQNDMPFINIHGPAPLHTPETAPSFPTKCITIPVAEYMYLHRLDALMDVLLLDETYCSSKAVQAVKDTVLSMRMANKAEAGAEE